MIQPCQPADMPSILICHHATAARERLAATLRSLGYRVAGPAGSAAEALEAAETCKPALAFVDLGLDGGTHGVQVAERLQTRWTVPVVFVTGFDDRKLLECARRVMPYGYVRPDATSLEIRSVMETGLLRYQAEMRAGQSGKESLVDREGSDKRAWNGLAEGDAERYRALFEGSHDAIVMTAADGAILDVNPAAVALSGYTRDELLKTSAAQLYADPADRERFLGTVREQGAVYDFELKLRRENGEERDCMLTSSVWRNSEGEIVGFQTILRDITEGKKAELELHKAYEKLEERVAERTAELTRANARLQKEIQNREEAQEALRRSEHQLRIIADNTPACISYVGMDDLRYRFVNRRHEETVGLFGTDIVGKHVRDVIGEANYAFALQYIEQVRTGQPTSYVHEFNLEHGKRWINVNYVPDFDEAGQVRAIVVLSHDITDLKQAEEELQLKTHQLGERIKELNCLYDISRIAEKRDVRLEESLQRVVERLPASWQYPEVACARIRLHDQEFRTKSFVEPVSFQSADIVAHGEKIGAVTVGYLQEKPERDEGPFLADERRLLDEIAERVGRIIERVGADDALKSAYHRLNQIIEFLPDPTFVIDRQGRVTAWNRAMTDLTGVGAERMIGKGDYEYALPFYGSRRPIVIDLVTTYDEVIAHQYDFIRQDGDRLVSEICLSHFRDGGPTWLMGVAAPLCDENGRAVGAIETIRDISELKLAESKLRESEEFYRLLVENLGEAIFVVDHRGTVQFANSKTIQLSGCSREELEGKLIRDFVSEPDRAFVLQKIYDRLSGATEPYAYQFRMINKDGNLKWVHVNSIGIRWKGLPAGLVCAADVTEMKKTEEELRSSEERYRTLYKEAKETEELYNSLLNSTLDAIVAYDLEGHVTYVNNGFTQTFGWVKEELARGVPYTPDSEREVTMRNVRQVIRDGLALKDFETKRLTRDGGLVDVNISASRFNDHEGSPAGMLVILRDISERKRAEHELAEALATAQQLREAAEEANRAKSVFVANMSHEIRTPMNAIIGMTDLALGNDLSPKLRDYLTKIRTSSSSLLHIIDDILDFTKIEAGRLDIEHVPFDVRDVISRMSDVVSTGDACRQIEFLVSLGPHVPRALIGDPLRLQQILTNLAGNAVKFTREGQVLVKVEAVEQTRDQALLDFSVEDTGIGIPEDKMGTLFIPFTQADGSTTRRFGGSGLGLTICKRLIDMMAGHIMVRSEPGKGSCFTFQLRFAVQPEAPGRDDVVPSEMQGMRVLIVDDNPTAQEILRQIIESVSLRAVAVGSGQQALAELIAAHKDDPYRLVLLDWRMPSMDGLEIARRIDREPRLSGKVPKIIMVTAFEVDGIRQQVREAGIDGFLPKPVQPSVLVDTIAEVFGKSIPATGNRARERLRRVGGAATIRGARILLVEDNEINQQVAREILEQAGAWVRVARHGEEALVALDEEQFDAVLMDIQMPEMDGYEATRKIRAHERFHAMPVIAMTAHAMTGDREKCMDAGMNDHVTKPVNAEELIALLARWIGPAEPPGDELAPTGPMVVPNDTGRSLPARVPGIDVYAALQRLGGKQKFFQKLLRMFAETYAHAGRDLRNALNNGAIEDAQRLAHTLRGVAGSIAAKQLQAAAGDLERDLKGLDDQALQASVPMFENALLEVLSSLQWLQDEGFLAERQRDNEPQPPDEADTARTYELVDKLAQQLDGGDLGARDSFAALRPHLQRRAQAKDLSLLEQSIERYDLDAAATILKRIMGPLPRAER